MKLTNELLEKAKTAKSAEELLEMAKAENIELTAQQAAEYFAKLHQSGELSDDELDNVAGGCGDYVSGDKPLFRVGEVVKAKHWNRTDFNTYFYWDTGTITEILPKNNKNIFMYNVDFLNKNDNDIPGPLSEDEIKKQ